MAGQADRRLRKRYALRFGPGENPGPYRRVRRAAGDMLRAFGLRHVRPHQPWLPGLQHVVRNEEGMPLIVWAMNVDRETLRSACEGFMHLQARLPDRAFVLVTDVADFAFFSRLGWLVEFIPALSAPGDRYAMRKMRYLAWRYRDAPALPVSAGFRPNIDLEELNLDGF